MVHTNTHLLADGAAPAHQRGPGRVGAEAALFVVVADVHLLAVLALGLREGHVRDVFVLRQVLRPHTVHGVVLPWARHVARGALGRGEARRRREHRRLRVGLQQQPTQHTTRAVSNSQRSAGSKVSEPALRKL